MPFNCCQCFHVITGDNPHQCDSCRLPLHLECLSLDPDEIKIFSKKRSINIKLVCNRCSVSLSAASELKTIINKLSESLDARLTKIESSLASVSSPSVSQQEEIIQESVDRSLRAYNVILTNVPENSNVSDVELANDILEQIDASAVVQPDGVQRLGKQNSSSRPRLLKLSFKKTETANLVIRKGFVLRQNDNYKNISVRSDKTKKQMNFFNTVLSEYKRRRENGESDIKIKHIHGVPQIIKQNIGNHTSLNSTGPTV